METLSPDNLLFLELEEQFSESQPCENLNHGIDKVHGGEGQWYLTTKPCPHCGVDRGTKLICDPYAQYLMGGGLIKCGKCLNLIGSGPEAYRTITRKG